MDGVEGRPQHENVAVAFRISPLISFSFDDTEIVAFDGAPASDSATPCVLHLRDIPQAGEAAGRPNRAPHPIVARLLSSFARKRKPKYVTPADAHIDASESLVVRR